MPQSAMIAFEGSTSLTDLAADLAGSGVGVISEHPGQIQVETGDGSQIIIREAQTRAFVISDLEADEDIDPELRAKAKTLSYWFMNFHDFAATRRALRRILERLVPQGACWVDSDHGWIRTGTWFLSRLAESDSWDWRTADPGDA